MKKDKIIGAIYCIIGLLIALGPKFLFPVCAGLKDDGTPMKCFYTSQVTIGLGMGIVMFGLILMLLKEKTAKIVSSAGVLFLTVMTYLIPNVLIGVCKTDTMRCRMLTLPSLNIISLVALIVCAVHIVLTLKENKN